jgi:hypothetical protein
MLNIIWISLLYKGLIPCEKTYFWLALISHFYLFGPINLLCLEIKDENLHFH